MNSWFDSNFVVNLVMNRKNVLDFAIINEEHADALIDMKLCFFIQIFFQRWSVLTMLSVKSTSRLTWLSSWVATFSLFRMNWKKETIKWRYCSSPPIPLLAHPLVPQQYPDAMTQHQVTETWRRKYPLLTKTDWTLSWNQLCEYMQRWLKL